MNVYIFWGIMLSLYLLSIFCRNRKSVYIASCVILILLASFRGASINDDTQIYINYYLNVPDIRDFFRYHNDIFETGYRLLNMIIKAFGGSYRYLFLSSATISVTLIFLSLIKYTQYLFLAVFLYVTNLFVVNELILMRTAISVAIIFYAIQYMENNKKKYVILVLFSFLFHRIAVMAFIPMLILRMNMFKHKKIIYFSIFIFFLIGEINILENLYMMLKEILPEKLGYYFQYYDYSKGSYRRIFLSLPIFIFFVQNLKKYKDQYLFFESLSCLYFSIIFQLFFIGNDAFLRVTHIYYSISIILLSNIYLSKSKNKVFSKFLISTLNLLLVFWTLRDGNLVRFYGF